MHVDRLVLPRVWSAERTEIRSGYQLGRQITGGRRTVFRPGPVSGPDPCAPQLERHVMEPHARHGCHRFPVKRYTESSEPLSRTLCRQRLRRRRAPVHAGGLQHQGRSEGKLKTPKRQSRPKHRPPPMTMATPTTFAQQLQFTLPELRPGLRLQPCLSLCSSSIPGTKTIMNAAMFNSFWQLLEAVHTRTPMAGSGAGNRPTRASTPTWHWRPCPLSWTPGPGPNQRRETSRRWATHSWEGTGGERRW